MTLFEHVISLALHDTRKHDLNGYNKMDEWSRYTYDIHVVNDLTNYELLELISQYLEKNL